MKSFFRVLALECRLRWPLLLLPLFYAVFFRSFMPNDSNQMFSLQMPPIAIFTFQIAIMLGPLMFSNRAWSSSPQGIALLEFSFTQPISRTHQFWAKTILYFAATTFVGIIYLASVIPHPAIRLTLPYHPPEEVEVVKGFYVESFPEAQVVSDPLDKKRNKNTVILPNAGVASALTFIAISILFAIFAQLLIAILPERRWIMISLLVLFVFIWSLPPLISIGFPEARHTISWYEHSVALVARYPILVFLGLSGVVAAIETLCRRRFVRKEIL